MHKKIKSNFTLLPENQKSELRTFIFTSLNDAYLKYEKIVFKELCSTAATISILTISNIWPNFIDELLIFMESSEKNFMAGLEILESIPHSIENVNIGIKNLMKVIFLFFF